MEDEKRDRLIVRGMGPYNEVKMIGFLETFLQELLTEDAKHPESERTTLNIHPPTDGPAMTPLTFWQKNVLGNMTAFVSDIESLEWRHTVFNKRKVSREELAALLLRTETARVLHSIEGFNAQQLAVVILNPHGIVSTSDDGTATATPFHNA